MPASHDHVHDLVDDYLHDLLTPADDERVERHCEECPACKKALEDARHRLAALQAVPTCEASGQLVQATLEKIDAQQLKQRRKVRRFFGSVAGAIAAMTLLLIGAHVYYWNLTPTTPDLLVLGQRELLTATNASLRIRLIDHKTGAALAGVPVAVELRDTASRARHGTYAPLVLASFSTDANGSGQPRFQLPDWSDEDYTLCVTANTGGTPEVVTQTVHLKRSWKLMLSSDKPVYQPGQTIHVRSLALRTSDLKPVGDQSATFSVSDPKGNILFKQKGATSKHGITSVDCPLDREILEGPYIIACKVGDTESRLEVEVKKYVLPKFKIDVNLDRPFYQPGEKVRCTVQVNYFFGQPVADGKVEVAVRPATAEPKDAERQAARTNAKGEAEVIYTVPEKLVGREQDSGDARLVFDVTATDSAGQKQTRTVERLVTTRPVRIEVIPENGSLVEGVTNKVYLLVTDAAGKPVQARLIVTDVEGELRTDERGVATFEITPQTRNVSWTIRASDAQGVVLARRHDELMCGEPQRDFLIRLDRATYKAGDTMRITALGGGVEPVFIDFIKGNQTILTETIDLADGRGETALDLSPDLFGTLELCAYRFDAKGFPARKTRVVYVHPAGQVNIHTTLDQNEYRPGKQAKVNFKLTDADGKPIPGALSLAAVDEAVFSVLQQAPGMERTFYTLEQQLLRPVYTIYPWSPDTLPQKQAPEWNRFEQALFSTTTRSDSSSGAKGEVKGERGANRWRDTNPPPTGSHTLSVATFDGKATKVEQDRTHGLDLVRCCWIVLILGTLAACYVGLWCFVRVGTVLLVHAVALFFLVPMSCLTIYTLGMKADSTFSFVAGKVDLAPDAWVRQTEATSDKLVVRDDSTVRTENDPRPAPKPGEPPAPRVRKEFPETLLWRPELITDDNGRASLDVELRDSITTWRLSASAVTADGRLGAAQAPIKVFQPFFVDLDLPVALTRGDEVGVPVVVYNYLDKPQTVTLKLENAAWFENLGNAEQKLELAAGEVRSLRYRLRVSKVGRHELQVSATGADGIGDALKKSIEVIPDGRRVEFVHNGKLQQPADMALTVPDGTIEGSVQAFVKIYPSSFSQLVEGLDNIFRMPNGCFEQTSSTTYPNVLALDYLKRTRQSKPDVEAKARQFIHLGYQRLVGFEVSGGGFDWFGRPPANRTLTAYGLMEFTDMARVHDVDPDLIRRTRQWLLKQRKSDGSWEPEGHALHEDVTRTGSAEEARLATTAYIAWAVFASEDAAGQAPATLDYLLAHRPDSIKDPHVLALVCNALLVLDPKGREAGPYLDRLDSLKKTNEGSKFAWWEQAVGARTTFYGAGHSGSIETTALATLGLIQGKRHPGTVRAALSWLVSQKDASGTWHSTQATVLSLKALLAGADSTGGDKERRIQVRLGEKFTKELVIDADQADVMKQLDLSPHLAAGGQRLTLTETSDTGAGYQVTFRYHVPAAKAEDKTEPLAIDLSYDRTELTVNDTMKATARVVNRMKTAAPMVMLDLPVPAGFAPAAEDFAGMVERGTIARFQVEPRRVLVYLRDLQPDKSMELTYRLTAKMPVKIEAPGATVYEYYDPDKRGSSSGTRITVKARE
jgi:uncharacterized protein YfaS (alpha-2-macroglobulin family)